MKQKVKIVDYMFAHATYSTDYQESKYIDWNRSAVNLSDKCVFYTDYSLDQVNVNYNNRFAWILESPDITTESHRWIALNNKLFDTVLTNNKELLVKGENFKFCPTGGCWIKPKDQKIYEKTKMLSIIASAKRMTHGHNLRHQIIQYFNNIIDVYGRIYNPIEYKLDGLKDYAFSLTIENTQKDYYFTEKLIDCFMTGTVPIYWGCPSIGDFFNLNGMIIFNNINELPKILEELSFEKYNEMKDAINDNFEKAKEYLIAEDYIYKNYLETNE
jgi:hypothetical protein